ncbi:MAG: UPF0104 family protein [Candidatus Electrothrix sp. AR4]|nr:UPF0104 family protein [Candidatus Electrothrix sp. AR4]
MKSKVNSLIYITLSLFSIVCLLHFFGEGKILFKKIEQVSLIYFLPQFIFIFCANIINSYLSVFLIQHFGLKLSWREWLPLGFVNSLSNLIFPAKTGTMIKAVYLKIKYNFAITRNFSLLLFTTFITYLNLFFLTGILLLFLHMFSEKSVSDVNKLLPNLLVPFFDLLMISMFVMTAIGIAILITMRFTRLSNYSFQGALAKKIMKLTVSLIEGSIQLSSSPLVVVRIFICTSLNYFIRFGMLYWGFLAVNTQLSISQLIFINLFFSLQTIVSLVPGNIGIQEVLITISSGVIGANFSDGLIVAAIIRITSLVEIFLFGFASYKFLNIGSFLHQALPKDK